MNKVCLTGRLTRDPELRETTNGICQTRFTLAVNRKTTNSNGEREADFINCVAWRGAAENIFKYFSKGNQIGITGRIQTGSYDRQDGTKAYTTDIIVDEFDFLDKKEDKPKQVEQQPKTEEDPFKEFADEVELGPDDLPF